MSAFNPGESSAALEAYKQGLLNQDDSDEWCYAMDRIWHAMSDEDQQKARQFAIELNRKESADKTDPNGDLYGVHFPS